MQTDYLLVYKSDAVAVCHELKRDSELAVCPVVPNAQQYVRDLADRGMIGTALQRLRKLPLSSWMRPAPYGIKNLRGLRTQNFATMLCIMVQMELPAFAPFRPPLVVLNTQITDLMLACGPIVMDKQKN